MRFLACWMEYISKLYGNDAIWNMEGPQIIESKVEAAVRKMKKDKAAGPVDN